MKQESQQEDRVRVGSAIRREREKAGLSQDALALSIGSHKQTISNYERGLRMPKATTISAIAAACGVGTAELIDGAHSLNATAEPPAKAAGVPYGQALSFIQEEARRFGYNPGEDALDTLARRLVAGELSLPGVGPLLSLLERLGVPGQPIEDPATGERLLPSRHSPR